MSDKKVSIKDVIRRTLFIVALIVFIISAYKLFNIWSEYRKNAKTYEEVQEYSPEVKTEENSGEEKYIFKPEDFDKLLAINSDFKGWITVPNTNVNYPLVQATDNEYYLTRNFKKESNDGGAIFISCDNKSPFEDKNTVIHGHHMKDGSMFASLKYFKEEDFFKNNNKIYINLKDKVLEYEIFSVYAEKANVDPYKGSFNSDNEYVSYLNALKDKSMFNRDTAPFNKDDKIITLSTCTYEIDDGRLLVHGRLIK